MDTTASPSTPSPDAAPAIDAELIRLNLGALGEDAAECLTFLTETFTQDTPDMLAQMRQSAEQQDAEGLRRSAHTLKSSSATLGATRLSQLCLTLETQARAGNLSEALDLVHQAEVAYEAAKIGLQTFEW